jgi:hypothetical protein
MTGRRYLPLVLYALALVVSSNGSHFFTWRPASYNTLEYRHAQQMARHGDPEAQRFVRGESDVNPFGGW